MKSKSVIFSNSMVVKNSRKDWIKERTSKALVLIQTDLQNKDSKVASTLFFN